MTAARPVDDRRLVRLHMAALAILERDLSAHTPLERRWAQEVLDLTTALAEARRAPPDPPAPPP